MADRFYSSLPLSPGEFTLEGPEAHHLAQVLRAKPGQQVILFSGDGFDYPAEILALSKKRVELLVSAGVPSQYDPVYPLHIAAAMPKGDRGDYLIEKLVELGATRFTPIITERTVVVPKDNRMEAFRRQVIEASKQCKRCRLMAIDEPVAWKLFQLQPDLAGTKWILHPHGKPIPAYSHTIQQSLVVAIGPEGGFTDSEVQGAKDWVPVSIGPRVLRIETAAVAIAAWVLASSSSF